MRSLVMAVMPVLLLVCLGPVDAQKAPQCESILMCSAVSADADSAPVVKPDSAPAAKPERARGLKRRERRKAGITFWSIRRTAKELKAEGAFEGLTRHEKVALLAEELMMSEPRGCADAMAMYVDRVGSTGDGERDWAAFFEALMEFLMEFLPILIDLFAEEDTQPGPVFVIEATLSSPIALDTMAPPRHAMAA